MPEQKTCFVVMGFGEKTNFVTQRKLDLDKSYRYIIKPAVENCGVKCIRADEIIHSGVIDTPMYQQLLNADLVIADLSTSNENAIYELGVRHALRPNTTIVMAEKDFSFPFDLGHVVIRTYEHLGTGIDFDEVMRTRESLENMIRESLAGIEEPDSPVYTFLPDLEHPRRGGGASNAQEMSATLASDAGNGAAYAVLLDSAKEAMNDKDFAAAKSLFERVLKDNRNDQFARQQLALATYKHKQPTEKDGLLGAQTIISEWLRPTSTNDPETLGLWGAVHKRLWEIDKHRADLDTAIKAYERGFYLKRDYYNGINYAFMLNVRASVETSEDEATADRVIANRVRRDVLKLVDEAEKALPRDAEGKPADSHEAYWISATRLEARVGLGELLRDTESAEIEALEAPAEWMAETTSEQLRKLRELMP